MYICIFIYYEFFLRMFKKTELMRMRTEIWHRSIASIDGLCASIDRSIVCIDLSINIF